MFKSAAASSRIFILILTAALLAVGAASARGQDETPSAESAVAVFNQGQDAHEKGDLQKAIELYQEALKILPEFPEAEYQRGVALVTLGKTTEAEKAFRKAVGLREDWTLAATALGNILTREGKYEEAEKLLNKAAGLDPSNAAAFVALADLRLQTGASADVLKSLLTRLREFSSNPNANAAVWTARSRVEASLGDLKQAKTSIESSLALEPQNRDARFQKASIAASSGEVELAEGIANALESGGSDPDDIALLRARIAIAAGRDADAAASLSKIKRPTKETEQLQSIVKANLSKTPAELESALANDAKNTSILGRLCTLYRVSDPTKALDYCLRASQADPANVSHAVGYAAALVQAKRYDEAAGLLSRIIAIAPDSFSAHANLATALFQQKQYKAAKSEYQWLLARQPDLTIAYFFLAICHDQLGEYLDAMANYQQFLKTADPAKNRIEIEKVNLRLPAVQKLIKNTKGGGNEH
jgi:tetratricopeptide (TPR) repeat protein